MKVFQFFIAATTVANSFEEKFENILARASHFFNTEHNKQHATRNKQQITTSKTLIQYVFGGVP